MNTRLFHLALSGLFLLAPLAFTSAFAVDSTDFSKKDTSTTTSSLNRMTENKDVGGVGQVKQDQNINQEVRKTLMADKELAPIMNKINIQENKGVVTLTGEVKSSDIKSKIEDKIKNLPGVVKVVNNLEVDD